MHLIHIGDTHLGRVAFGKTAPDGSNLRETLINENYLSAIETIIEKQPDVVVHGGDLFDSVKPKTKSILVALQSLDMLKEAGISFVAVAGNHSMPKNSYTSSVFEILKKAHPEIHVAYSYRYENVQIGDTLFHLIPNMLCPEDYLKAARESETYNRKNPYCFKGNHVLVTHGLASTITDQRLSSVAEFELTPEVLREDYDYIALNHVHHQQKVGPNAWYSGSIEHLTYGEINDKKGALDVEITNGVTRVSHLSLVRSPMKDIGTIKCSGLSDEEIVLAVEAEVGLIDGRGDQMFQITLDYGSEPYHPLPSNALSNIADAILNLKVRIVSQEIARPVNTGQDMKGIDYVREFETFLQQRPMTETQRTKILSTGTDTLKTVMENHQEIAE